MSLERKKRRRKRRSVSETSLNESGSSGSSGQSNSGQFEITSDTNIYFQLKYVTVRQQGRPGQPEIINHEPGDFAPRARQ